MTIKPSDTNYATPKNIIAALKQANREKDAAIDSFAEANVELRQKIIRLTKLMAMMKADIAKTAQELKEAVET